MVRKRGNGIYYTSFRLTNGERVRRSTFTEDYEEALKYALKLKEKLEVISTRGLRTWKHAVLNYSKKVNHKRSWPDILRHIQYFDTYFSHITDLNEINRDLIEDIKDAKLGEGVKGATVNRYLTTLKSILMSAYDREWIERVPKIEMLPESKGRTEYLTRDEYNKLIMALSGVTRQIVKFAAFTGLRAGNIFNLKWYQVDLRMS